MQKVTSVSEYPEDTKYLLIVFKTDSVYIPGDERSRTNPGHGYPAETRIVKTPDIFAFNDQEDLKGKVQKIIMENPKRSDYIIIPVGNPIKVNQKVSLSIS